MPAMAITYIETKSDLQKEHRGFINKTPFDALEGQIPSERDSLVFSSM